jgi:hypothetical protein
MEKLAFQELDTSVEASGPHDFAVRFSAVRYRRVHVHRIPSRVRDDREPPLMWDGTVEKIPVIWCFGKPEYFSSGAGQVKQQSSARIIDLPVG